MCMCVCISAMLILITSTSQHVEKLVGTAYLVVQSQHVS